MMGLVIEQTFAQLDIRTTPSELSTETRRAKLELSHKEAQIDVQTERPRVVIDQYECFATSGLMNALDLNSEAAQAARQHALEYISKVAGDGDSMAAIENGSSPLPDIVEQAAYPVHEFGLDYMPKARPKITVTGSIEIKSRGNGSGIYNGVQGTYTPGGISFHYTPAKVNISVGRHASISMRYERTGFSRYI